MKGESIGNGKTCYIKEDSLTKPRAGKVGKLVLQILEHGQFKNICHYKQRLVEQITDFNEILTKNHFNHCATHPLSIKLTKFDTNWRPMKKCSINWNTNNYWPILWMVLIETS